MEYSEGHIIQMRDERISIHEFAKAIARDLGLSGAEFGLHVASIENKIMRLAGADDVAFYEPDTGIAYDGNEIVDLSGEWLISHSTGMAILRRFFPNLYPPAALPSAVVGTPSSGESSPGTRGQNLLLYRERDGSTRHKLASYSHALDAVIARAEKEAEDPNDYQSVWATLVKIACTEPRPAPLLGYSEGEGVKYATDNVQKDKTYVAIYSKRAFAERQRRRKEKHQAN